jgi:hypothetical protein
MQASFALMTRILSELDHDRNGARASRVHPQRALVDFPFRVVQEICRMLEYR